jgi:RNA 3'-terminal phosphate cyclase (ATP)
MNLSTRLGDELHIDGSLGEGGGQILRSSLALSLATGRPFAIDGIRAGRKRPGLAHQHRCAVLAAAAVGTAEVEGAEIGSTSLRFAPRAVAGGDFIFEIGTAGSTTLVLETILFALLGAPRPSTVRITGGTHNPTAPPFDFLDRALRPLLARMGAEFSLALVRPGFHPGGGGVIEMSVAPSRLAPLEVLERGRIRELRGTIWLSALPAHIADREIARLDDRLGIPPQAIDVPAISDPVGPGNAVVVDVVSEGLTEVFTAFGRRGLPAEEVVDAVAREAKNYRKAEAPVSAHLADQLLLPLALAGGGRFRTVDPTSHTRTQAALIEQFLLVAVRTSRNGRDDHTIEVRSR